MSDHRVRSRKGCLTCRNRRKKCDEGRPTCQRCKRAGIECLGYAHVDNPAPRPRRPRNAPGTPALSEASSESSKQCSSHSSSPPAAHCMAMNPDSNSFPSHCTSTNNACLFLHNPTIPADNPNNSNLPNGFSDAQLNPDKYSFAPTNDASIWWSGDLGLPGSETPSLYFDRNPGGEGPLILYGTPPLADASSINNPVLVPPGFPKNDHQVSFGSDLSHTTPVPPASNPSTLSKHSSPAYSAPSLQHDYDEMEDDSDTEGVMSLVRPALTLDRSNSSNSLPFILSNYLRWITRAFFEPLKVAQRRKDYLIERYMHSDNSRNVTMLAAMVMASLDKDPTISLHSLPAMRTLENRVNSQLALVKNGQQSLPESRVDDVLHLLHDFHDMIALQCLITPLAHVIHILDEAAPVYQHACPEPPGTPIHLSAKLVHPDTTLRYFPALDIFISFNTGRPMHFRYDTSCVPELCERLVDVEVAGLQWMNGVPDQFLVMLARMNMLLVDAAPNVEPHIIQELEFQIDTFKPVVEESPDPYLKVARLAVQEAWRQVMYVYLYMGLCGVASNDPRVEKALKKFLRLLDGVKPGRMPDIFLVFPLCAVGTAANKPRDRDLIRQRMLGVRECSRSGTCGNDALRVLEEIWAMCDMRSRYARWIDRRLATSRITGII